MQHHAQVVTALESVPVTRQHPVPVDLEIKGLANPGMKTWHRSQKQPWQGGVQGDAAASSLGPTAGLPRANITCDVDHPDGDYTPPSNMSVLMQHVAFWDRDGDGIIWPSDAYVGFRYCSPRHCKEGIDTCCSPQQQQQEAPPLPCLPWPALPLLPGAWGSTC